MKHIRYLVYRGRGLVKQALVWDKETIHFQYAKEQGIEMYQVVSLGYIGFDKGKWICYEHYQMTLSPFSYRDKKLAMDTFLQTYQEKDNRAVQQELTQTYQAEKDLLKQALKSEISQLWTRLVRGGRE